jgi:hypothetical protein
VIVEGLAGAAEEGAVRKENERVHGAVPAASLPEGASRRQII